MVPPARDPRGLVPPFFLQFSNKPGGVRKLQEDWSPQCCCNFRTFENCKKTGPPMFENCKKTGPPILLAVFEQTWGVRKLQEDWSHQCCCSFRTFENCKKTGPPPLFENCKKNGPFCSKSARTPVRMFENCKNTGGSLFENCKKTGPPCSKTARTLGAKCSKSAPGFKYYRWIRFRGLGFRGAVAVSGLGFAFISVAKRMRKRNFKEFFSLARVHVCTVWYTDVCLE